MREEIDQSNDWNFELTENAQKDIKEIWLYISENSVSSADNLITDLFAKLKLIANNPKLGRMQNNYLLSLRSFPFKNYIIFYTQIENGIEIFRIIHSSRNIEDLFDEFFENIS